MRIREFLPWNRRRDAELWDPLEDVRGLAESAEQALAGAWYPKRRSLLSRWFGRGEELGRIPWVPEADMEDGQKELIVSVALPGMDKKDIHLSVSEDELEIGGERRLEKEESDGLRRLEQAYGGFHRVLSLPVEVKPKETKAEYKDGVLKVTLVKAKAARARAIKVA